MAGGAVHGGGRRGTGWRLALWGGASLLLLLPLVAMQFSPEMNWDGFDFALLAAMLAAACGAVELGARMRANLAYRGAVGLAVAAAFLLVFVNLAVGIIGSENNPANLMYAGVLAIALVGALAARGQPAGMVHGMVATALAQAAVGVVALVVGLDAALPLDLAFGALWLGAAWLFRRAAQQEAAALR